MLKYSIPPDEKNDSSTLKVQAKAHQTGLDLHSQARRELCANSKDDATINTEVFG